MPKPDHLLLIYEKAVGTQHPEYGMELGNLPGTLMQKRDAAGAIPLYYKTLEAKEASIGADYPRVAHTLTNLACLNDERKELTAAAALAKRENEICLVAYGDLHPETQQSFKLGKVKGGIRSINSTK